RDDDSLNAMPLEQEVEVGIRKTARTPMLGRNDIAWLRLELAPNLAAPRPVLEGLRAPRRFLHRRDELPRLVIAGTISPMQGIEDTQSGLTSRLQDLEHVLNTLVALRHRADARPDLATL